MTGTRIIIVGGGFAGVRCAKTLRKRLPPSACEIVLFNRENHLVFHPLLPEVAGGSINPDGVAVPLRYLLPSVHCRTEAVTGIDLRKHLLAYEGHDSQVRRMRYDHIVLTCGATVNLGSIPGMADHAFPLKTVGDAIALRAHLMQQLDKAEVCDDSAQRRQYLSVVVVGGGHSGVETAGEINDLLRGSRRFYPAIAEHHIKVTVVHSKPQLLPEVNPELREFARGKMEQSGIEVLTNARVEVVTADGAGLNDGRMVPAGTVVCTIGTSASAIIEELDAPKEHGRLLTDADMRLRGIPDAWAAGDCACNINGYDGCPCPPTGQSAERQGRQVAQNILRVLQRQPTRPLWIRPLGQLCSLGGHSAVADFFGVRVSGFFAWFLWRGVYLFKLPSWSRRLKVGFDWAWDIAFSRDLTHLKTDQTERISRAHYRAGDYVFRVGDPAVNFYAIQRGEVEVLEPLGTDRERLLAVLGPGDFFGEMAMLESRPHRASVRARSDLAVMVMGRTVFSQISECLAPLRDVVANVVRRRSNYIWQRLPIAQRTLAEDPVSDILEAVPAACLQPDSTLEEALRTFKDDGLTYCCVLDTHRALKSIVTRTDFLRAFDAAAALPPEQRRSTPVEHFMVSDPVVLTHDDSCLVAAETMRDRRLKGIPVVKSRTDRRVVGYVRAETLMHRVLQHLGEPARAEAAPTESAHPALDRGIA